MGIPGSEGQRIQAKLGKALAQSYFKKTGGVYVSDQRESRILVLILLSARNEVTLCIGAYFSEMGQFPTSFGKLPEIERSSPGFCQLRVSPNRHLTDDQARFRKTHGKSALGKYRPAATGHPVSLPIRCP